VSYSPFDYWKERGKIYKKNFHYDKYKILQEEFLLDHLDSLNNFHSVLELGCGFGRITKLLLTRYSEIQEYLAVDLSPHQIENAKTYLDSISFLHKGLEFQVSNIQSFKSEKKYDLVILSEVLMHILPSEIDSVIGKLVSLSNKHIINIDWFEEALPQKIASHNFIHPYELLYKKYSEVSSVQRISIRRKKIFGSIDTRQSIFHVRLD
jgi:trans-aconitate methyltransferase